MPAASLRSVSRSRGGGAGGAGRGPDGFPDGPRWWMMPFGQLEGMSNMPRADRGPINERGAGCRRPAAVRSWASWLPTP